MQPAPEEAEEAGEENLFLFGLTADQVGEEGAVDRVVYPHDDVDVAGVGHWGLVTQLPAAWFAALVLALAVVGGMLIELALRMLCASLAFRLLTANALLERGDRQAPEVLPLEEGPLVEVGEDRLELRVGVVGVRDVVPVLLEERIRIERDYQDMVHMLQAMSATPAMPVVRVRK